MERGGRRRGCGLGLAGAPAAFAGPRADPVPVPGGLKFGPGGSAFPVPSDPDLHAFPPAVGFDMSTITDSHGVIAGAHVQGAARQHGSTENLAFDADMRFMAGLYKGTDGCIRHGSFGFA